MSGRPTESWERWVSLRQANVSESTPTDVEAALDAHDLDDERHEIVQAMYEHLGRVMSQLEHSVEGDNGLRR